MAAKPKRRTVAEITKAATRRRFPVTLYLAGHLAGEIAQLEAQLADFSGWTPESMADTDPRRQIVEKIRALQEEIRESATEFVFQALPPTEWDELLLRHPGRTEAELFDPTTIVPDLISSTCVEPAMTAEEFTELATVLNRGQLDQLENAAFTVNQGATAVPFSFAASAIAASRTGAM